MVSDNQTRRPPFGRSRRRAHLSEALKVIRSQAQQDLHAVVLVESHHALVAHAHLGTTSNEDGVKRGLGPLVFGTAEGPHGEDRGGAGSRPANVAMRGVSRNAGVKSEGGLNTENDGHAHGETEHSWCCSGAWETRPFGRGQCFPENAACVWCLKRGACMSEREHDTLANRGATPQTTAAPLPKQKERHNKPKHRPRSAKPVHTESWPSMGNLRKKTTQD